MKQQQQQQYHNNYLLICLLLSINSNYVDCYVGINWGRHASQGLMPSMVTDLILQNGIPEVKISGTADYILTSLIGTNLGLVVTLPDNAVSLIKKPEDAEIWIANNLLIVDLDRGINLRYICIGTLPFSRKESMKNAVAAADGAEVVEDMQGEIDKIYPNKGIKVSIEYYASVMTKVKEPSKGDFEPEIKESIKRTTALLSRLGAPIFLNMYPMKYAKLTFNDLEFAFFDNNSTTTHFIDSGGYKYTNMFEVLYDMFVCALEKLGFRDIKVVVGKVGWPTDGTIGASAANAERFHQGLVKHIQSGKGTPRRPGPIDVYIQSLQDENMLKIDEEGAAVRHWGMYEFDGKPKYSIDFTGKGEYILPVTATGVTRLPRRWCVFNGGTTDMELLQGYVEMACDVADCTNMNPGGSCAGLGYPNNISYAFNAFFQYTIQKIEKGGCDFGGFGLMTIDNPSTDNCTFHVNIITTDSGETTVDNQGNIVMNRDNMVENQDIVMVENQGNMIMIMWIYNNIVMGISILLILFMF